MYLSRFLGVLFENLIFGTSLENLFFAVCPNSHNIYITSITYKEISPTYKFTKNVS